MAAKKCPVCGVSVKAENLERHVRNQHPKENVDLREMLTEDEQRVIKERRAASRPGLTRGGRRMLAIVAVAIAAILVALVAYELFAPPPIGAGGTAPLFTLNSTDGTVVSLAAYKGTPVLVEFMDVDCMYCQEEAPVLSTIYPNYSASVRFVRIDINFEGQTDTAARINSFRASYNTPWPYCLDPGRTVQNAYGVSSTPTLFIINRTGTITQKMVGTAEASQANLVQYLNAVTGG